MYDTNNYGKYFCWQKVRNSIMYESPINKIMSDIQQQIIRDDENNLLYQVRQAVGYFVDKEELLKALNYDRDQYQKGYHDGLNADKWIPVSERLPWYGEKVLCWTTYNAFEVGYRDNEWGQDVWTTGKFASGTFSVVAWMPLPEPYRQEAENG